MRFLDLDELSIITTDSDQRSFELMFITRSGTRYYANGSLAQLEKALADNRSWLRTSLKYLINLDRIVRSRVNRARDLMIEGFEGWLVNAVSPNSAGGTPYLDQFQKRFITRV